MGRYYKSKNGSTFLNNWSGEVDLTIFDEITKEEFDAHQKEIYTETTQTEIEKQKTIEQIEQLKNELVQTDYVALKLSEAIAEGTEQNILSEYSDVFARRKQIRTEINRLESTIVK